MSETATSVHAQVIKYNELVLTQLLAFRENNPDFYFHLRTNKKRSLLEAGHWFPGTDYVHVGLVQTASGDHSTKSVGFNISCKNPDRIAICLNILFKGNTEKRPAVLEFYRQLADKLKLYGMHEEPNNSFVLYYGEDVEAALKLFLERDWPIFKEILKESGLENEIGISANSFNNKLGNVQSVRTGSGNINLEQRIARLCWNTNGWVMPSGRSNKTTFKDSFEFRHGFGFEEWLLDMDKVLDDGYHYGFLQPVNQHWESYRGKSYSVQLFTKNNTTQERFWVGEISSLEVIDTEKSNEVVSFYQEKGWMETMNQQLGTLNITPINLEQLPKEVGAFFNVRFLPEQIHIYEYLIPFTEKDITNIKGERYSFIKDNKEDIPALETFFEFKPSVPPNNIRDVIRRTSEYREIEHQNKHDQIQKGLFDWLIGQYAAQNTAWEQPTGLRTKIDVVLQEGNTYVFYEVKTYNSLMTCIRIALGQLIEYSYYPNRQNADKLIIVSDHIPKGKEIYYMSHLRNSLHLPVYYAYFDLHSMELSELY